MEPDLYLFKPSSKIDSIISQMNISDEERKEVRSRFEALENKDRILIDTLFLIAPNYAAIKPFLTDLDCVGLLRVKAAEDALLKSPSECCNFWVARDFEMIGDFFLDVAQREKHSDFLRGYFLNPKNNAGDIAGIMHSLSELPEVGEKGLIMGLEKIKKARGIPKQIAIEKMISSDIFFMGLNQGQGIDNEKILRGLASSPLVFQKASIDAFKKLSFYGSSISNVVLGKDWASIFEKLIRDSHRNKRMSLLSQTIASLEGMGISCPPTYSYPANLIKKTVDGVEQGGAIKINQELKEFFKQDCLSELEEMRLASLSDNGVLQQKSLNMIHNSLDHSNKFATPIYQFPTKDMLLLFKEIEKFDQENKMGGSRYPLRDSFSMVTNFCVIAQMMAEERKENGLNDFSQSKEVPSIDIVSTFHSLISRRMDEVREMIKRDHDHWNQIEGLVQSFVSELEGRHLIQATAHIPAAENKRRAPRKI